MKKILMWVGIIFFALVIIGIIFGEEPVKNKPVPINTLETTSNTRVITPEEPSTKVQAEVQSAPNLSGPQSNAVRSAKQYLNFTGFSRSGLINQLSSDYGDGYDVSDATVAVDSLNVDWNEQVTRSAKQYLDMTGFSCDGLIQQLSSDAGDKYTLEQAKYGAKQVGACG